MNQTLEYTAPDALVLHLGPVVQRMTDDEFYEFCQKHPDLRIERGSEGDLVIQPPAGGETAHLNFNLTGLPGNWVEVSGSGAGFGSPTIFHLPNGADRSPDVAWVRRESESNQVAPSQ
ncbi:MAG: Uma2 family endonuclease [Blastocatellia bacterium]